MAGHLGASVVAGYFLVEDVDDFGPGVEAAIIEHLDRILSGEEEWFNTETAGITIPELFAPVLLGRPDGGLVDSIADALSENIDEFHESGHNVIFASIAIRALLDHPTYATPELVKGIHQLIANFTHSGPGRGYYGEKRGWAAGETIEFDDDIPAYTSSKDMAEVVVCKVLRNAHERRNGFGGVHHIINHAAALIELSRYGYEDLARRGFAAHRKHVLLWKALPELSDELGPIRPNSLRPQTRDFWITPSGNVYRALLSHRIKTLYGLHRLVSVLDDEAIIQEATERLRYLF